MATKKKSSKRKIVKSGNKGLTSTSWKQRLANTVEKGLPVEKPLTGNYIVADGGKMVFTGSGNTRFGDEINCVVVGWCFENTWHDYSYVPGEPFPPTCFSVGLIEDDLKAHSTSPDMQGGVNNGCIDCELNEWGSGVGKGKACGNRRRLALVVDADKGKPDLKILTIPPTSLNNWKKFIEDVNVLELHTMQVAVTIAFDTQSDAEKAPLIFNIVEEIENDTILDELAGQLDKAEKLLGTPCDVASYVGNKGTSKKKAVKKRKVKSKFSKR